MAQAISNPNLFPYNTPNMSPVEFILHAPTCLWRWNRQNVPKRRHIKFRRRGITQKNAYNMSSFLFFSFVSFIRDTNWQHSVCLIRMVHFNRCISIMDLQPRGLQFTSSKTPQKSGGGTTIWPRTCELYITLPYCQSKPQLYNTLEYLHIKTRFHNDKTAELDSLTHKKKKQMYSKVIVLTHPPS